MADQDQLEEYRKKMQQRYNRGGPSPEEENKKRQEEQRVLREQQLRADEELARKLQGSYTGTPVIPQPPPQGYRPPDYVAPGQGIPGQYAPNSGYLGPNNAPPNQYVPPNQYAPPNQYPPAQNSPYQYPPANYPPYVPANNQGRIPQNPRSNSWSQSAPNAAGTGCLPQVNDKCCGINTQTCVLVSSALMAIGIIASLIALSA